MAKIIEIPDLTERQADWLKELLTDASAEATGTARNCHLIALGADTQKESVEWENTADEQREYAQLLLDIAAKI